MRFEFFVGTGPRNPKCRECPAPRGSDSLNDWQTIYKNADKTQLPWLTEKPQLPPFAVRFFLSALINEWLAWAKAQPTIEWIAEQPRISLSPTLPALLATGLMMAVTRTEGLAVCSACGDPYLRVGRQIKRGQQNYCPECRLKAGWRSAARRRERDGRRRRPKRRVETNPLSAADRALKLLALARELGLPPIRNGAGDYWREFHTRARARHLVDGRGSVSSRMAYLRARRRLEVSRSPDRSAIESTRPAVP